MMEQKKLVPKRRFKGFEDNGEWNNAKIGTVVDVYDGAHQSPRYTGTGSMFL